MARKSVYDEIEKNILKFLKQVDEPVSKHVISESLLVTYKIPKFRANPTNVYTILMFMRREGKVIAFKGNGGELLYEMHKG